VLNADKLHVDVLLLNWGACGQAMGHRLLGDAGKLIPVAREADFSIKGELHRWGTLVALGAFLCGVLEAASETTRVHVELPLGARKLVRDLAIEVTAQTALNVLVLLGQLNLDIVAISEDLELLLKGKQHDGVSQLGADNLDLGLGLDRQGLRLGGNVHLDMILEGFPVLHLLIAHLDLL